MKKTVIRGLVASALAGAAVVGAAAPAPAAPSPADVAIVDEPDTTNLDNAYTFAPLGVPVFGLIRSVNAVPGKLLPSFG
ncbi:hypothetical protein [Amycolatopsis thermophila]|uniref:ABC-type transport system substrate-binding protein n=1 Tax=Amycolatopsis thermophila TaxID=206084 RepID=A0ABU0ETA6_9PSEU|nr:hypothetical protein [Amycolatopsis thermophila]MDQ0378536.1 ABC-type transport system substrate-binding protein [Amycolatopsis thermophila]